MLASAISAARTAAKMLSLARTQEFVRAKRLGLFDRMDWLNRWPETRLSTLTVCRAIHSASHLRLRRAKQAPASLLTTAVKIAIAKTRGLMRTILGRATIGGGPSQHR